MTNQKPLDRNNGRLARNEFLMRTASIATFLVDQEQLDKPLIKRRIFWIFCIIMTVCLLFSAVGFTTYLTVKQDVLDGIPPPLVSVLGTPQECELYICNTTRL
mmetsp:Transcript_14161/g.16124  ORF Transcript_14161/g.16124 Transcript_14161/m.16124 type:complete len:103 (+) Transcript_14161:217-525(+)